MLELRETGDWDIFLGPPERARAETGGADQWVLKQRECSGFARENKVTSASLGYPLSVFNKNFTLKGNDWRGLSRSTPFNCFPFGFSRKFKIDTVERYRMTHQHLRFFAIFSWKSN